MYAVVQTDPGPVSRVVAVILAAFLLLPSGTAGQDLRLGDAEFPNSGASEAQPAFERGLLLLHSFEYRDAAAAFREAQELDPDFAMAYWGEAMTHGCGRTGRRRWRPSAGSPRHRNCGR